LPAIHGRTFTNQKNSDFKKLNSQKINASMKKWINDFNRVLSKKEVQMSKKTHEEVLNITDHE
jgi:hypothetical protein